MAFDRATTSFAQIEDKFRKAFNLAGLIGAAFAPDIRPVLVVGNTDDPGYASFRGRHFTFVSNAEATPLANGIFAWVTPVDVVLSEISCWKATAITGGTTDFSHAYLFTNDATAFPASPTPNAGTWVDQKMRTADAVPFTRSTVTIANAPVTALFSDQLRIASWGGAGWQSTIYRKMHLPAGSALVWEAAGSAVSSVRYGVTGRIY